MTTKEILQLLIIKIPKVCFRSYVLILVGTAMTPFLCSAVWRLVCLLIDPDFWMTVPQGILDMGLAVLYAAPGLFLLALIGWLLSDDGDKPSVRRGRHLSSSNDAQSRIARHAERAKRRASRSKNRTIPNPPNRRRP